MTRGSWLFICFVCTLTTCPLSFGSSLPVDASDNNVIRMRVLAGLFIILFSFPAVAAVELTSDQTRVIKAFDFEERDLGNVEETPMNWLKVEGPGMPHYVNGRLSSDRAATGKYAFRFDLNGGSLLYRYPSGKIKAHPHANYHLTTQVFADSLTNARARVTAYFADVDGRIIKNSVRHSDAYAGGDKDWHTLSIDLQADDKAAWIVLELGLLQPAVWKSSTLGNQTLFDQDIHARAYFDDLIIAQVPRTHLSCDRPGNVFKRSDPIALRVRISDRLTDDLVAKLLVRDASGSAVHQYTGAINLIAEANDDNPHAPKQGSIVLPDLSPGWYRASLQLLSGGVVVGDESLDLVRLADDGLRIEPDRRIGVIATHLPMAGWSELPALLPYLGASRVKLSVWDASSDVESEQLKFALLLDKLQELQITPTACLAAPAPKVAGLIGGATWPHILKAPPEAWQPQLAYLVSRYSGYLDRWQFGIDEQADDFVTQPLMRQSYDAVRQQFDRLIDRPDLAMPWPALFEADGSLPATVALSVPSQILPEQIPLYIADLRDRNAKQLSLSLQLLPENRYGRDARLRDYVQRIAYSISAGADRIDLPLPFTVSGSGDQTVKQPSELLLIQRTVLQTLGNAVFKGRVPVNENVEAFLFDRQGEGVMLLWSKAGADHRQPQTVQIVLGKSPRRVDLWGNVSPVLQPKNASGVIDVEVGAMPLFLVGIDGQLAQLRSSFAFDNPLIESSFKPHVRRLRFVNPYPTTLSGRIRLSGPSGWNVVAQNPGFSLAPGETYDGAVTIEFPYSSFAGIKTIDCDVQLQTGDTRNLKVPVTLKLGLGDVGLSTIALRDGNDILVQQVITNYSTRMLDYTAFTLVPAQARQERLVQDLKPGQTVIKKYRFTNVHFDPTQPMLVRSGVKELEGTRVLNDEVTVQ